jgi:hypothetical protein
VPLLVVARLYDIPTLDLFPRHLFLEQLQNLPILAFRAAEDI